MVVVMNSKNTTRGIWVEFEKVRGSESYSSSRAWSPNKKIKMFSSSY